MRFMKRLCLRHREQSDATRRKAAPRVDAAEGAAGAAGAAHNRRPHP